MAEVRLIVAFAVLPGAATDYLASWQPHARAARTDEGCLQYELFQSLSHCDRIVLLERWRDRSTFDAHWSVELTRPRPGAEFRDPAVATEAEIYWRRQLYRWNDADQTWEEHR
jgi:quinol monooxygenase YgiN